MAESLRLETGERKTKGAENVWRSMLREEAERAVQLSVRLVESTELEKRRPRAPATSGGTPRPARCFESLGGTQRRAERSGPVLFLNRDARLELVQNPGVGP